MVRPPFVRGLHCTGSLKAWCLPPQRSSMVCPYLRRFHRSCDSVNATLRHVLVCPLLSFGSRVICRLGDATRAMYEDSLGAPRSGQAGSVHDACKCVFHGSLLLHGLHTTSLGGQVRYGRRARLSRRTQSRLQTRSTHLSSSQLRTLRLRCWPHRMMAMQCAL